jgi:hypothetical protein
MIKYINRAPNDEFTYNLFCQLIDSVAVSYESYYVWSSNSDLFKEFINNTVFTQPNVIIGIKDLLDLNQGFDYWNEIVNPGIVLLSNMAYQHPDKNFIIITSLEHAKIEFDLLTRPENLQIIEWGGDITNQSILYPTVTPVLNKNFNSSKTFISLNRHPRCHRLILLSYITGLGLGGGHVSYIGHSRFKMPRCILDIINWQFEERHNIVREHILSGYKSFNKNIKSNDEEYHSIYPTQNDNVDNFITKLTPLYQNSFIEIVGESSFLPPAFLITEKFLNSVYGCNFPILLSGVGAVAHLRQVGFDMFDDIVDHAYDQISNPIDRIVAAIEDNKKLLSGGDHVKQLWQANQHRFERNVDHARNGMYEWYKIRAINQFNQVKWLDN